MDAHPSREDALRYIRAKVDQLLSVIGTLPLRPEELDDESLISLDPIGIVADAYRLVNSHLSTTIEQLKLAQNEIRSIFDTVGAAIVVLDLQDRIEDCNRRACDWLFGGQPRAAVLGRAAREVCPCADALHAIRTAADGVPHSTLMDGRDVQVTATRILDDAGQPARTVMLFSDITEQKKTERDLRLYAEIFGQIPDGILITDADNRIVEINDAVTRITGYARTELIGRNPGMLGSGQHEASFYETLWRSVRQHGYWQGEINDRRKDGRVIPLLQSISAAHDAAGRLTHHIAVMTDISSIKEAQTRLDYLAHHDLLTELPNRLLFNDRLCHAIERAAREKNRLALLFIDLDRFKNVNDSLGHQIGDLLLVEASRRLRKLVRRADTVSRLGGDEFVVLMETSAAHLSAVRLAEKIVAAFQQPFQVGDLELHIGCSIGIALFPDDGEDATTLMKNADAAMYRAKEAGRAGYARYSDEHSTAMRLKLELDNALRSAVARQAFELHFQPIVDIGKRRVAACEALIRWPGGPAAARSPDLFIPAAEENRLILPLGRWIMREALRHQRRWRDRGLPLDYVSVNISMVQITQDDFAEQVIALLAETGMPGAQLQIELTENALMADTERCARVLSRLREHGIRVAIDDFGTGYSSLSYLKQLPIDNLKIDRSFVRDIPGDQNDCAIAAAVIGLARTLGLDAIAEGIETVEQQDYLASIGCAKMQGYLYARALPAPEFESFVIRPLFSHDPL
jgi:diguanylate cyclase (GGDEF)-like protein/PAS domain S-box-containing protein